MAVAQTPLMHTTLGSDVPTQGSGRAHPLLLVFSAASVCPSVNKLRLIAPVSLMASSPMVPVSCRPTPATSCMGHVHLLQSRRGDRIVPGGSRNGCRCRGTQPHAVKVLAADGSNTMQQGSQ